MSTDKKLIIAAIGVLVLMGAVGAAREYVGSRQNASYGTDGGEGEVVCTMDAKLCPDGSYVGRVGPNCEFAECPLATSSNATTSSRELPPGGPLLTGELVGTVMLGPTCPVMRNPPDSQCADKPYVTTVVVSTNGKEVGRQETDAQGRFQFAFLPGTYVVTALGGNPLPRCSSETVVLRKAATTTVDLSCDTGIR